ATSIASYALWSVFFSSRRRHTRSKRDWSSDVCSSDLQFRGRIEEGAAPVAVRVIRGVDVEEGQRPRVFGAGDLLLEQRPPPPVPVEEEHHHEDVLGAEVLVAVRHGGRGTGGDRCHTHGEEANH